MTHFYKVIKKLYKETGSSNSKIKNFSPVKAKGNFIDQLAEFKKLIPNSGSQGKPLYETDKDFKKR